MKTVLKIGIDALPNADLARFTALFQVAETRTVVAWVRVRPADADVVVCHGLPWRSTRAISLCLDPVALCETGAEVVPLERGFRVLSLIAALDRASARAQALRAQRAGNGTLFVDRLRHWVVVGADKLSAHHARVMAALSRRAVTRDWMATGGSLSFSEIDALLSELREHGALHGSGAEPLVWQPAKPAPAARQQRPGFLGKLRHWFGAQRAATRGSQS